MKVSLSLEKSDSNDLSIMVDVLRASTTITMALNHFKKVIPVVDHKEAIKIASEKEAIIAGERRGATLEGFDAGNSPIEIQKLKGKTLVLTTSNGTRIMEGMKSQILVGCFTNAQAVAAAAKELANEEIEVVMAGVEGRFAIEDFLGAGEIISNLQNENLDEYGQAAVMAVQNKDLVEYNILKSRSARRLSEIGFKKDVEFCLQRNISDNVPIFREHSLEKY
ncbi:MAG: 2-phosphosulfolactate phosphatase [Methanobacteriaceae archaeon]|nr:2-phosphosulfolactate phosphatase [Methanobacteriaceae archaeon]MDP2837394.1 2-phosphosulfolactate phosphatase [Methanobacteriaceae archaeon]MDP3036017.1 2-phosphosulfolactate phosphatase [Methanobacteriaceae archaeon]MDP3485331.1 2-phosphosulfolactate phosphatase [Methanobacteriaceae archaeon]MDP3624198.1 2-phosphosulfolactate phosphatase [Methanobacteriaceae archaeon]